MTPHQPLQWSSRIYIYVCFFDGIADSHNEGQSATRPIGDSSFSSVKGDIRRAT